MHRWNQYRFPGLWSIFVIRILWIRAYGFISNLCGLLMTKAIKCYIKKIIRFNGKYYGCNKTCSWWRNYRTLFLTKYLFINYIYYNTNTQNQINWIMNHLKVHKICWDGYTILYIKYFGMHKCLPDKQSCEQGPYKYIQLWFTTHSVWTPLYYNLVWYFVQLLLK